MKRKTHSTTTGVSWFFHCYIHSQPEYISIAIAVRGENSPFTDIKQQTVIISTAFYYHQSNIRIIIIDLLTEFQELANRTERKLKTERERGIKIDLR